MSDENEFDENDDAEESGAYQSPDLPEDEEEGELWLVSYADLMTLIACFFILLTAFANYDPIALGNKFKVFAQHFGGPKLEEQDDNKLETLTKNLRRKPEVQEVTNIYLRENYLEIVFNTSFMFRAGSIDLTHEASLMMDGMVETIKSDSRQYRIIAEGHTDPIDIKDRENINSNWALSSLRAASVIERFEAAGFEPKNLVSIGYADTRPIKPFYGDKGRHIQSAFEANRRVVLKVLEPVAEQEARSIKLGFGRLFKEEEQPYPAKSENPSDVFSGQN